MNNADIVSPYTLITSDTESLVSINSPQTPPAPLPRPKKNIISNNSISSPLSPISLNSTPPLSPLSTSSNKKKSFIDKILEKCFTSKFSLFA